MSTLTKVVIVLLTLATFFLCASVVVYVATADNFKEKYEDVKTTADSAVAEKKAANEQLENYKAAAERKESRLADQISQLDAQVKDLQAKLSDSQRKVSQFTQRIESLGQTVEQANETAEKQTELFKQASTQLQQTEAKLSKKDTENKQLSDTLLDKEAIIATLESEKKRLMEDKSELQARLNRLFAPEGKVAAQTRPVTTRPNESARVEPRAEAMRDVATRDIGLKGVVTVFDPKNSMAQISIGGVDGVQEGMEFFVIRGDEFVCKLKITNVDETMAIGKISLVQDQPAKGDVVTSNL